MADERDADRNRPSGEGGTHHRDWLDRVTAVYDRWSVVYDWNPAMLLVWPTRRRAVRSMGLRPGDTVVDMGTGTGANLPHLRAAVGPTGTVLGVDASPGMLSNARARIERQGWENVHLLRGDVSNPPIEGPVDGILSSFVLTMFEDSDRLVAGWLDHLDDGALALVYASPSARWYGAPANVLLDAYCRLFNAGWGSAFGGVGPGEVLARRGRRARTVMIERAARCAHADAVFGLVSLDTGHVRPSGEWKGEKDQEGDGDREEAGRGERT